MTKTIIFNKKTKTIFPFNVRQKSYEKSNENQQSNLNSIQTTTVATKPNEKTGIITK